MIKMKGRMVSQSIEMAKETTERSYREISILKNRNIITTIIALTRDDKIATLHAGLRSFGSLSESLSLSSQDTVGKDNSSTPKNSW